MQGKSFYCVKAIGIAHIQAHTIDGTEWRLRCGGTCRVCELTTATPERAAGGWPSTPWIQGNSAESR